MLRQTPVCGSRGSSLIEVLVTLIILAIGLLGVAGLQAKMGAAEVESYQREQALLALADMMDRLKANSAQAASYVTPTPLGTGDGQPADCSGQPVGVNLDECQWSHLLQGYSEQTATGHVGAMQSARGCITQTQALNQTPGFCAAGIYQVTIVWQGTTATSAPTNVCAQGQYGNDAYRRAVAGTVTFPATSCLP